MDIDVPMGELVVTKEEVILIASAVGSCVVVILYEPVFKITAMCHAMLPALKTPSHLPSHPAGGMGDETRDARYVDVAIDTALEQMCLFGAAGKNIEARLIGGANMFGFTNSDIGRDNVISARKKLKEAGIRLIGESTGGSCGRRVEFSSASGIVTVKSRF